jgi:Glyoxalase/Bleomycin resistance protein/Dioxygenase superfamily
MLPSPILDMKAFVPARDPELSKAFYTDLGFTINFSNDEISELQIGSFRFLLQKFYVAEHAGNFMMALNVEDVDAWWENIQKKDFKEKYPGIMCKPPAMQPWGTAGALPERSYGRSVAHHREPEALIARNGFLKMVETGVPR